MTDYSGYLLRFTGSSSTDTTKGNVYRAYTGVEMVVSFPSQIIVKAWMRIDNLYDGNLDIMRVTTYKSAPQ